MSLKGKVALVTGGSRGLGRADALALAEAGADVVIADILIEGMKDDENLEKMGPVDILVNNAATLDHTAQILEQKDEFWERDLRVNLTGAFNCSRAVWPDMKERGWGRIINMASVAGTRGGVGQASYSTTKAGIIGFTKSLALEGARYGITCNVICPGVIASESFNFIPPEIRERLIRRTAFRKAGEPQDVADAIVFLVSDKAKYITGVVLNVSGGIELFTF